MIEEKVQEMTKKLLKMKVWKHFMNSVIRHTNIIIILLWDISNMIFRQICIGQVNFKLFSEHLKQKIEIFSKAGFQIRVLTSKSRNIDHRTLHSIKLVISN